MYKFIVLATILAWASALPNPKPVQGFEHLHPVVYSHEGQNAYVGGQHAYVGGQHAYIGGQQAYVGGHQAYVGGHQAYVGVQKSYVGEPLAYEGVQKAYHVKSAYPSSHYVSGYAPAHAQVAHSSPVVYAY